MERRPSGGYHTYHRVSYHGEKAVWWIPHLPPWREGGLVDTTLTTVERRLSGGSHTYHHGDKAVWWIPHLPPWREGCLVDPTLTTVERRLSGGSHTYHRGEKAVWWIPHLHVPPCLIPWREGGLVDTTLTPCHIPWREGGLVDPTLTTVSHAMERRRSGGSHTYHRVTYHGEKAVWWIPHLPPCLMPWREGGLVDPTLTTLNTVSHTMDRRRSGGSHTYHRVVINQLEVVYRVTVTRYVIKRGGSWDEDGTQFTLRYFRHTEWVLLLVQATITPMSQNALDRHMSRCFIILYKNTFTYILLYKDKITWNVKIYSKCQCMPKISMLSFQSTTHYWRQM